ncbi:MAG: laccase domain-containing protein [Gemmatimonadetes bacterium]|nr:laccase domain-containing protein [Gemmatimonadota bacterium]
MPANTEVELVRERPATGAVPLYVHAMWSERFPWLVQGTTAAGPGEAPFDLRLFGSAPVGRVLERWEQLREATGCPRVVISRQVHGTRVLVHGAGGSEDSRAPGLFVTRGYDGHATRAPGLLLTVSVADCVPISAVDPARRAIALLHGGWRGIAAGVVEAGVSALVKLGGSRPDELYVHLGPAICGGCYEVAPEVHAALGFPIPARPAPVDLRALLVERAIALGVRRDRLSVSAHCTKCGDSPFFSHRGGRAERQMGVLGIRG